MKISLQTKIIALIAAFLSVAAFLYFYHHGMTNLYGDGLAHLNIARKVVDSPDDSLWQRYVQIGSPWLPLQTVLLLPLVANDSLWRSGVAGSLLSMLGFVITAVTLFQLSKNLYARERDDYQTLLPLVTFAIFVLNPSALFMQSTPMTELVFMAAISVAVWCLQAWANQPTGKRLMVAALAMTVATMSRYEAWSMAAIACVLVLLLATGNIKDKLKQTAMFSCIVAVAPLYWLWHNWEIYGDALWFLTGPYSARGIYLQNRVNLGWSKIFVGNAPLDVLLMLVTVAACTGLLLIPLAGCGFIRLLKQPRRAALRYAPTGLLLVPFLFHCFSLYRGEIQIFPLSAFGLFNVRYGLPHLLSIALFAPAVIPLLQRFGKTVSVLMVATLIFLQYGYLIADGVSQLAVYQEGYRNGVNAKPARQWAVMAAYLRAHPPPGTVWMQSGSLGPVVSQGGLRFSQLIHEGTARWHQINDAVPQDVTTIVIEKGDALEARLRQQQALSLEVSRNFQETFAAGDIRLLQRK
ncbi:MAG: hypothetical protein HY231_01205 [Acidobacteria bacterium]|nr:hypothetical protein [Acidobacteriota bacterium]